MSDKSSDVIKAFNKFLIANNVKVMLNSTVTNIMPKDGRFLVNINGESIEFDKIILATGGVNLILQLVQQVMVLFLLKKLGHNIIPLKPSLVPIEIEEPWIKELQGLSLRNVNLKTYEGNKLIHEEFGEMIFTHYGISGPIVLTTSNYLHNYDKNNLNFKIDLKPALENNKLDSRILRDFQLYSNKHIKNALDDLLPPQKK